MECVDGRRENNIFKIEFSFWYCETLNNNFHIFSKFWSVVQRYVISSDCNVKWNIMIRGINLHNHFRINAHCFTILVTWQPHQHFRIHSLSFKGKPSDIRRFKTWNFAEFILSLVCTIVVSFCFYNVVVIEYRKSNKPNTYSTMQNCKITDTWNI